MSRKIRDTDTDWKRVAEEDPFWGFLSEDKFRTGAMNADKLERLMASGEQYIAIFFALISKHFRRDFSPARGGCPDTLLSFFRRITAVTSKCISRLL
jgi:hypothetical protein